MATYKTGDLLRSIKFACMSEGKAIKNHLLLGSLPLPVACNIILPNICELWLKSAVLFLAENKREAGEKEKKKVVPICLPGSDYWMQNFFFFLAGEKDLVGMFLPSGWDIWYPSWDQS